MLRLLFAPLTLLPLLWAPGLIGLLTWLGFSGTIAFDVLAVGCIVMFVGWALNARGTAKAREHFADMFPWMVTVGVLVSIVR